MKKKKQTKKKNNKKNYLKITLLAILFLMCITFGGFVYYIYISAPEFKSNLLYRKESVNAEGVLGANRDLPEYHQ